MSAFQYQYQQPIQDKEPDSKPRSSKLKRLGKYLLLFVIVFVVVYLVLNFPALWSKLRYHFQTEVLDKPYTAPGMAVSDLPSPYTTGGPGGEIPITLEPGSNGNGSSGDSVSVPNNQIYIPKIDVRAPIRWNIEANQAMGELRYGVVHIKPTGLPGQQGGNIFITGHSSYYYWDPGKYKHIFALLPQIQKGNNIFIRTHGQLFKYQVHQTMVVRPDNTSVMKPVGKSIVSLMTCVPIGTSLRRFIVRAKQIEPRPAGRVTPAEEQETIPGDLLPGIFH